MKHAKLPNMQRVHGFPAYHMINTIYLIVEFILILTLPFTSFDIGSCLLLLFLGSLYRKHWDMIRLLQKESILFASMKK